MEIPVSFYWPVAKHWQVRVAERKAAVSVELLRVSVLSPGRVHSAVLERVVELHRRQAGSKPGWPVPVEIAPEVCRLETPLVSGNSLCYYKTHDKNLLCGDKNALFFFFLSLFWKRGD